MAPRIPFADNVWLRRFFRGARVLGLGIGVYTVGHLHGYVTHARDPALADRKQLLQFLHAHETKLKLENGTEIMSSTPFVEVPLAPPNPRSKLPNTVPAYTHCATGAMKQVETDSMWAKDAHTLERVGRRIFSASREVCDLGLQSCDPDSRDAFAAALDPAERELFDRICAIELDLEDWQSASRSLQYPWNSYMLGNEVVNAFFTPMLPHAFLVNRGLIAECRNDDELAHVLGHEMSHMICGHVEKALAFSVVLSVAQLFVLALLDPTGTLSFGGELLLWVGNSLGLITSAYSREEESEADNLGLIIAARACYDTKKAHLFFERPGASKATGYFDTHPADEVRVHNLSSAATSMHILTSHASCASTRKNADAMYKLLGLA
mmetsp:Transcript_1468/g.4817  ORF Transcript_1468/g.4817 Transcript_1468/m.4817 type:complete len:380 (-) Transcript_1468:71-1210(-)|eukprot:CAMPEP_0206296926 /NCGR_PEP_ID=MMETSP0106_2-20121207/5915_1 /ASSEMBLY_ACC=CAM_ASM_000206 /TAXON_ID=81532 /ORGANISM="Acanthoeca-like sp., Strain 10tr" /LENGTH=379 /DNA_ID=CAMNT_0053727589 /DNA_START=138 /DNA_END=1277 /DNA_ORIENTATION=+